MLTPQRVPVTIVGIARFGAEDAFGGTSFTAFTLQDARRDVAQNPGRITSVSIRAARANRPALQAGPPNRSSAPPCLRGSVVILFF